MESLRLLQMLNRFLSQPVRLKLGGYVQPALKLTGGVHKALKSIVKLSGFALGQAEVIPDARVFGRKFCGALQVFVGSFEITILEKEEAEVVEKLGVVLIGMDRSLERLQSPIAESFIFVSNAEEVVSLAGLRIERCRYG